MPSDVPERHAALRPAVEKHQVTETVEVPGPGTETALQTPERVPAKEKAHEPPHAAATEGEASAPYMVDDLKVAKAKWQAPFKMQLPCAVWLDSQASYFLTLENNTGIVRCITFPGLLVRNQKDFKRKLSWMSLSAAGLLLSDPEAEKILVADPDTLEIRTTIDVPKLKRAVSAPSLKVAVACDQGQFQNQKLYSVDLEKKKIAPIKIPQLTRQEFMAAHRLPPGDEAHANAIGVDNPAVSPDGKHVFTESDNITSAGTPFAPVNAWTAPRLGNMPALFRFAIRGDEVSYQECSPPRLSQSPRVAYLAGIAFSPDSKLVCLGVAPMIRPAGLIEVYEADALRKPRLTLGKWSPMTSMVNLVQTGVGIAPRGEYFFDSTRGHALAVYTAEGAEKKEYVIEKTDVFMPDSVAPDGTPVPAWNRNWRPGDPDGAGQVLQFLIHPDGKRMVLVAGQGLYAVELPKWK